MGQSETSDISKLSAFHFWHLCLSLQSSPAPRSHTPIIHKFGIVFSIRILDCCVLDIGAKLVWFGTKSDAAPTYLIPLETLFPGGKARTRQTWKEHCLPLCMHATAPLYITSTGPWHMAWWGCAIYLSSIWLSHCCIQGWRQGQARRWQGQCGANVPPGAPDSFTTVFTPRQPAAASPLAPTS